MVIGMFAPPPKATIGLPTASGPGGAELGLAVLAPAEDPVIERAIRPGQDLDLAEPAVGLGIEHGRNHKWIEASGAGGLAAGSRGWA